MKNAILPKIVWGGLLYTQLTYAYVIYSQHGDFLFDIGSIASADMGMALVIVSMVVLALSYFIPKYFFKKAKAKDSKEAVKKFMVPFIIRLFLLEAVTIYGMVLSFMAEKNLIGSFMVASLIGFALCFPTSDRIKKAVGLVV